VGVAVGGRGCRNDVAVECPVEVAVGVAVGVAVECNDVGVAVGGHAAVGVGSSQWGACTTFNAVESISKTS
jgi:hypothetical protein